MGLVHLLLLLGCAAAIYGACEWFVNAVEWLGLRLHMGTLAVGTVLAAVGTALPESVVTLVAVTLGHTVRSKEIGIGAAMGGPLALATIAYGVTGWTLLSCRRRRPLPSSSTWLVRVPAGPTTPDEPRLPLALSQEPAGPLMSAADRRRLTGDQTWFLCVFVVKVALGLVAFAVKPWLGLAFFAIYAIYVVREMRAQSDAPISAPLDPLKLQPHRTIPSGWAVATQTLATVVIIFVASQLFVAQLDWAGPALGLPASTTALLLSPLATELPEVMNAVIWVRQGKSRLALANISGAMMIQATIPSGLGLLFTPWRFDGALLLSGLVTGAAIIYLLTLLGTRRLTAGRLSLAAAFYPVFALGVMLLR